MFQEKLFVKNMVCDRCIRVVKEELEKTGFQVGRIVLGEVEVRSETSIDKKKVNDVLMKAGFELLEDKNVKLIEKIKTLVIELVHHASEKNARLNLSDYISKEVGKDYHSLSTLFSQKEGITIEKFFILQKIERVKELLIYGELTLSEISYQLSYSSVAHLSNQFKQVTGLTPSEFRKISSGRNPIDKVGGK